MKNNILNDLLEYREFLTDKFGINNMLDSDNYHNSLDKIDNGINRYLRERLGNLILKEKGIEDNGDKINYIYKDYQSLICYIGTYDKNKNIFILKNLNENIVMKGNRYYLVIDENGMKYFKYNQIDKYLIVEELKYGEKIDVSSITTKFYDSSVISFLALYENKLDSTCIDKINEKNIVPEIEFVSKVYEADKNWLTIRRCEKREYYDYVYDEYVLINGIMQGTNDFMKEKTSSFNKKYGEAIDLCVFSHFDNIKEESELISECLGLNEEFKFENGTLTRKRRKF